MTTIDLLLQNARAVTTQGIMDVDISIDNGKITNVARSSKTPRANKTIDLDGRIVIPGVIDPHVHFREPGETHKEDFKTGSLSALHGGVTTALDMPNNKPRIDSKKAFEDKQKLIAQKSYVDYGLYFEITNKNISELNKVNPVAYKCYLDSDRADIEGIAHAFAVLENARICVHPEDSDNIHPEYYNSDPASHSLVRTREAELEAIPKLLEIPRRSNHLHFSHATTGDSAHRITQAGKGVSVEATYHHLFMDTGAYNYLGTRARINPSLKTASDKNALWARLGDIDCLGSDHAPHKVEEKDQDIQTAASGYPGTETMLPLLVDAVNRGMLAWEDVVRLTSHKTAEIFKLKKKGEITAGKDADLVVIDNALDYTIKAADLHSKCGWTPYEGRHIQGAITHVFLRGELAIANGEVEIKPGFGSLL